MEHSAAPWADSKFSYSLDLLDLPGKHLSSSLNLLRISPPRHSVLAEKCGICPSFIPSPFAGMKPPVCRITLTTSLAPPLVVRRVRSNPWGIVLSQCLESGWCEIQPDLDQCCLRRTLTQPLADLAKERSDRLAHQRKTDVPAGLCSPCLHPLPSLPHPTEQGCRPRRIIALNGSLRAVFFKGNFDWASFWP